MSEYTFRIQINDSQYRKVLLSGILVLFVWSVWLWQKQVIPYQIVVQILLSFVLLLWFGQKIVLRTSQKIISLKESGQLFWLQPADETPWDVSSKSLFNRYLLWLVLENSLMNKQQTFLVFKDSVSDENWRHLCRVVSGK